MEGYTELRNPPSPIERILPKYGDGNEVKKVYELPEIEVSAERIYKVTLDPGHGINGDTGKKHEEHLEKDFALKLSNSTYKWLVFFGLSSILTRTKDLTTKKKSSKL